jgi:hypothetical protein
LPPKACALGGDVFGPCRVLIFGDLNFKPKTQRPRRSVRAVGRDLLCARRISV